MDGYTAVNRGATIMRRYRSPDQWMNGWDVHFTFPTKMVVRVREAEVSRDNTQALVLANVAAIEAWAQSVRLLPQMPNHLVMNVPNVGSYVVVPTQHWERVKQKLAEL